MIGPGINNQFNILTDFNKILKSNFDFRKPLRDNPNFSVTQLWSCMSSDRPNAINP